MLVFIYLLFVRHIHTKLIYNPSVENSNVKNVIFVINGVKSFLKFGLTIKT